MRCGGRRSVNSAHHRHAVAQELLDEAGVVFALAERLVVHDRLLEWNRGLDSSDHVFIEGPRHTLNASAAAGSGGNDFGDHRVVIRRDGIASIGVGVNADATTAGCVIKTDVAGAGLEIFLRILGVDTTLDGMTARLGFNDIATEMLACSDLDLLLHEIASVDLLGDGVLDLDAGVHFHEVEIPVIVYEILDGAGVCVADALTKADRCLSHFFAKLGRHEGRRALFDDLLVAALEGAVTLTEMHDAAVFVTKNLKLNVVRINDKLLDINRAISEGLLGFHAGGMVSLHQAAFVAGDAHATTTATGDRFNHHRKSNFAGNAERLGFGIDRAIATGRDRNSGLAGAVAGGIFIAHEANRLRRRTNKLDVATGANLGEVRVLRQKSIARVDRIGIANLRSADDAVDFQIALGTYSRPDANGLVGELHMKAVNIGLRVNGNRLDTQFLTGADNTEGNFAAIGDQDFFKHGGVAGGLLEAEECLTELHRLAIFGADFRHNARDLGFDLVHDLHGFDDANNGIRCDLLANREECRRIRRWS